MVYVYIYNFILCFLLINYIYWSRLWDFRPAWCDTCLNWTQRYNCMTQRSFFLYCYRCAWLIESCIVYSRKFSQNFCSSSWNNFRRNYFSKLSIASASWLRFSAEFANTTQSGGLESSITVSWTNVWLYMLLGLLRFCADCFIGLEEATRQSMKGANRLRSFLEVN